MKRFIYNRSFPILLGCFVLLLYILPYILFGENSYINIHDNLDCNIAHIKAIMNNDALFENAKIIPVMNGLPCSLLLSPIDVKIIIFLLLSSYWAIIINSLIIKLTAFVGMYCLLSKYIVRDNKKLISFLVSLAFALVPFYPDLGISSAGVPLLIYAYLNLRERKQILSSFLIIIYYGFYSSFVLSGLFICVALFVYMMSYWRNSKRIPLIYFNGLFLLSAIYIYTNWNLFDSFLFSTAYESHRVEFFSAETCFSIVKAILGIIMYSQYHAGAFWAFPIIFIFIVIWYLYKKENPLLTNLLKWLFFILGMCFVFYILRWLFPQISILQTFQFDRFYFLFPALCFIILAVILDVCFMHHKKILACLLLTIVIISTFYYNPEYRYFVKKIFKFQINSETPTYSQFYDETLFDLIEKSVSNVPRSNYKIVCLGLYPSILEYNGFYTLDSYVTNYPLSYKREFRNVIAKELDKSSELKDYFDNWGSRCYLFSSELGLNFLWGKNSEGKVCKLDINTKELKKMDCSYIFSAVNIENFQSLNLDYIGSYTTQLSFWNIRVYKIK